MRGRPAYAFERKNCHSDDSTARRHSFVSGSHGSRRTGGIFCWYCRHEICYGYYIMPNAEGRNEAFSFLYKYFAVAPKVVVYDFSCALQDYCLNRQPDHLRDTLFLVDKFHWFGHTACSRTYNLTQYPAYAGLNSQIAEQFNSALARIKCSVSQMTQRTFMFSVRYFLQTQNEKKLARLKQYSEHSDSLLLSDGM